MRVISGTARGTKLKTLDVPHLRPMLDRVKTALFNIIRARLPGTLALDAFSGSGALGIEALSGGAAWCTFVERDQRLARLLSENLAKCHLADRAEVLNADFLSLSVRPQRLGAAPVDLVFVDPPYAMVEDPNDRARLFAAIEQAIGLWIAPGALVMLHHAPLPHALWPTERLECFDRRVYGRSQITLFDVRGEAGSPGGDRAEAELLPSGPMLLCDTALRHCSATLLCEATQCGAESYAVRSSEQLAA